MLGKVLGQETEYINKLMRTMDKLLPYTVKLVSRYLRSNTAARKFIEITLSQDILIDHITPRTKMRLEKKARPWINVGYVYKRTYRYEPDGWWAKVYALPGQPTLFVDRAYSDRRGKENPIPNWVHEFPESKFNIDSAIYILHHIAFRIPDIYKAKAKMESAGIAFGEVLSGHNGALKQVFSKPEMLWGVKSKKLVPGTVMELIERSPTLTPWDFIESQASSLMKQSMQA